MRMLMEMEDKRWMGSLVSSNYAEMCNEVYYEQCRETTISFVKDLW